MRFIYTLVAESDVETAGPGLTFLWSSRSLQAAQPQIRLWIDLMCLWNGQQGLQREVLPLWQGRPSEKQTIENRMDQRVTTLPQNVTDVCPRPCFTTSCEVSLCLSSPLAEQKNQTSPTSGHNKDKHMESCKQSCKQAAVSNKDKLTKAIL